MVETYTPLEKESNSYSCMLIKFTQNVLFREAIKPIDIIHGFILQQGRGENVTDKKMQINQKSFLVIIFLILTPVRSLEGVIKKT